MSDLSDDNLAALRKVAEDPLVAPSRRVRARRALKTIAAQADDSPAELTRSDIIDLLAAAEPGSR